MSRYPRVPYAPAGVVDRALDYLSGVAGQSGAAQANPFAAQPISDEEARQALIAQAEASTDPAEQERLGRALFAMSGVPRAPENQQDAEGQMLADIWRSQMPPPGMDPASFFLFKQNMAANLAPTPLTADGATAAVTGPAADVGDGLAALSKRRVRQGFTDMATISVELQRPDIPDAAKQDLVRQWEEAYPDLAQLGHGPRPMSREQAIELKSQIEENEANEGIRAILAGEMPERVVTRNAKGELEIPGWAGEAMRMRSQDQMAERQFRAEQAREERELFKMEMELLETERPREPKGALAYDQTEQDRYAREMSAWIGRKRKLLQSRMGQTPSTSVDPAAAPSAPAAPAAPSPNTIKPPEFSSPEDANAAFAAGRLGPFKPFVIQGKLVQFDEDGVPHLVR